MVKRTIIAITGIILSKLQRFVCLRGSKLYNSILRHIYMKIWEKNDLMPIGMNEAFTNEYQS